MENEERMEGKVPTADSRLKPFSPYQKFTVENLDRTVSPAELRDFLSLEPERGSHVTVCMPIDRQGNTLGSAHIIAPRTFTRHLARFHRNPTLTLKGRQLHIATQEGAESRRHKKQVWVKTDLGVVTSQRTDDVTPRLLKEVELRQMETLVDAGAYYWVFKRVTRYGKIPVMKRIIDRAYISGVEKIVVKCTTPREAIKARKIAREFPRIVYYTAGVSEQNLEKWQGERTLSLLRELLEDPACVAVGEIGLRDSEKHVEVFTKQVELACEVGKPILLTDCKHANRVLEILSKFESRLPSVCVSDVDIREKEASLFHSRGVYLAMSGFYYSVNDVPWISKWIYDLLQTSDDPRILLASQSPNYFPKAIDKVNVKFLETRASCMGIPLTHRVTEHCRSLAHKYRLISHNEPMGLQNLVELIGIATEPATIATVTRRCSYNFFKFHGADEKLASLDIAHVTQVLEEEHGREIEEQEEDNGEEEVDSTGDDGDDEDVSGVQTSAGGVHVTREKISETSRPEYSDTENFTSWLSWRRFFVGAVPVIFLLLFCFLGVDLSRVLGIAS